MGYNQCSGSSGILSGGSTGLFDEAVNSQDELVHSSRRHPSAVERVLAN